MRGAVVGECLEFPRQKERYPAIKVAGKTVKVHRYVFEYFNGPTDLNVCHTCDNTYCFLPEHLFAGTQKDNVDDMVSKGRHRFRNNMCGKNLHELIGDNVKKHVTIRNGVSYEHRSCKPCELTYMHEYRARQRADAH
jgi:hypothetical protein